MKGLRYKFGEGREENYVRSGDGSRFFQSVSLMHAGSYFRTVGRLGTAQLSILHKKTCLFSVVAMHIVNFLQRFIYSLYPDYKN